MMSPSGKSHIFQQDNAEPHTLSITVAWPCRRKVQVLNWPATVQALHQKTFGTSENKTSGNESAGASCTCLDSFYIFEWKFPYAQKDVLNLECANPQYITINLKLSAH